MGGFYIHSCMYVNNVERFFATPCCWPSPGGRFCRTERASPARKTGSLPATGQGAAWYLAWCFTPPDRAKMPQRILEDYQMIDCSLVRNTFAF